ncbi:MAG: hypothetical protein AB1749_03720 [Pseudomonadota bacterium]
MRHAFGLLAGIAAALVLAGAPLTAAQAASCANKAGRGWASDIEGARFQAWEAVLQDTDWGMWAAWMVGSAKVGTAASGYSVSNMREKCGNDGSSKVCTIQAKLCK